MAQTYVTTHTGAAAQSGLTATVSVVSATAGNHLRLNTRVSSDTRSIVSVSGGAGNTWTSSGERPTDALSNNSQELWYCENCAAGTYTVTITWDSSAASNVECFIDEFSGTATSSSLDVHTSNGAAIGASPLSVGPSSATTNANDNVYTTAMSINGANARPLTTPASYTTDHAGAVNAKATQFVSAHLNVTSTGTQTVSWAWTGGNSAVTGILAAFKDAAGGGPTTVSTTDTATLTEGTPVGIAVSGPTDTMSLAEKGSVAGTIGGLTDSLSLSETVTVGPQASDVLSLDDAAFTIVATDVASINDFTLSEGPIVIGVGGPSDALSLAEGTTRIVATISISDVLTLDDSNVTVTSGGVTSLTETDTLTLGEFLSLLDHAGMGDAATLVESVAIQVQAALQDSASLTERASVAGTMALSDSLSLAESLSIAIVGGFTGYAKGTLVIVARLAGTVSVADRLKGSTAGAPRLRGTQTTQPVGPP